MWTFWRNRQALWLSAAGLGFTLLTWGLLHLGFLASLRAASTDTFLRWRDALSAAPPQVQQILLVAVDDESQRKLSQRWPWDRAVFADLLRRISPSHPKGILFDFAFVGAGRSESDAALTQAIREGPPILLAAYQDPQGELMLPLADFLAAGGTVGMINKPLDSDQVIRRIWTQLPFSTTAGPVYGIEFQAACLLWGASVDQIHRSSSGWTLGGRRVPTGALGDLRINYLASAEEIPTFPFWRVLEGSVPASQFRDRLIIVGPAREITHDIHSTPLGRIPGIAISANGLVTFLTQRYIRSIPGGILFPLALGTVWGILAVTFRSRWTVGLLVSLLGISLSILGGFALTCFDLHAEAVSLFLLIGGAWGIGFLTKHVGLVTSALRLQRQAITDHLSGAFTSRYFRLCLEQGIRHAHPPKDPISLLLVQVSAPSQLLQDHPWEEVQRRMKTLVSFLRLGLPPDCLVGRLHEDRFGLLVPHQGLGKAQGIAQRLRQNLPFSGRGIFAIGLASLEQNPHLRGEGFIQCAEMALRRAISKGYGSIEVYDSALDAPPSDSTQKTESAKRPGYLEYVASELEERNLALERALTDLRQAHNRLEEAFLEVTKSLVLALETKDPYTAGHLERVCRYATRLSERMHLPPAEVEAIREAALLHDIGKIGLPDEVLHKIGALTPEEREIIRQHLAIGAKILEPMKFFKSITTLVTHHHERYDGKGYPDGLAGDSIPVGAQMIAIADAFDAMTTHRGYNQPKNIPEALTELRNGAGSQFNPVYVDKFAEMILEENRAGPSTGLRAG